MRRACCGRGLPPQETDAFQVPEVPGGIEAILPYWSNESASRAPGLAVFKTPSQVRTRYLAARSCPAAGENV